jgi:hypothetical protein
MYTIYIYIYIYIYIHKFYLVLGPPAAGPDLAPLDDDDDV